MVKTISCALAPAPSKIICPLLIVMLLEASAAPQRTVVVPSNVVAVNEVRPAMVVAVPPKEMLVEPTVRELLAS